jgi:hypothetical protein
VVRRTVYPPTTFPVTDELVQRAPQAELEQQDTKAVVDKLGPETPNMALRVIQMLVINTVNYLLRWTIRHLEDLNPAIMKKAEVVRVGYMVCPRRVMRVEEDVINGRDHFIAQI